MKVLHAADLHIDSPLRGLSAYEGAPVDEIRGATRRAVEALVATALDEAVDLVVIAGDVFDGDWPDYGTGLFWIGQLARLGAAGIPVVTVAGNHDAASEITRALTLPDNVTQLGADAPGRVVFEELGIEVIGQSYRDRAVTDDLTSDFPDADPGLFTIGLLHTSLDGREGHAPYAPTTPDRLRGLGYQYWALGHVHTREIVARDPWIVFPGNTQGRHAREIGPKGASVIEIEGRDVVDVRHVDLDVVRWFRVRVDIDGLTDVDGVLARIAEEFEAVREDLGSRLAAVRVEVVGSGPVHDELWFDPTGFEASVRALAVRVNRLWVEKVGVSTTRPVDVERLRSDETVAAMIDRVTELRSDPEALSRYGELFEDLRNKIGRDVLVPSDHPLFSRNIGSPDHLRDLLGAVLETMIAEFGRASR